MADLQQRIDLAADVKSELGELVYQLVVLRAQNRALAQRLAELEPESTDADQPAHPAGRNGTKAHA